ncbi:hypothetical protein ACTWP5_14110 [Streptomyces sp. 4N509B]|uniref:hypothetical protein n=1 Tax=Streptomyces sp. 4N509B TaxID=3457413 RepID=UPI003FCF4BAB
MSSEEPSEAIAASADGGGEGEEPFTPAGGRHAKQRRSLFQRLHMPFGKAVALAAMPSAVLLGTGFTSPLAAKADQHPDSPFSGTSCVEMPDTPLEEEQQAEGEQAQETDGQAEDEPQDEQTQQDEQDEQEQQGQGEDEAAEAEDDLLRPDTDQEQEQESATPEDAGEEAAEESGGGAAEETAEDSAEDTAGQEPAQEDAEDGSGGLLGPIGQGLEDLGQGVVDFFTPGDGTQPEEPAEPEEPTPEPTEPEEDPAPSPSPEPEQPPAEEEPEPEEDPAQEQPSREESTEEPAEDEPEQTPDATAEDGAAEGAGDTAEGQEPFPCPEERQVAGVDEDTALVLPNDEWYLEASSLTLYGLDYHGVVNVTTANGTTKQVLKFTAERVDIGDLHQIVDGQGAVRNHVATAPGSTSTFRNGTVTMYTERLEGNLFGLIPIVFDPEHQPPLDLPIAHFTNVFVVQAGQFGGELTMQGMSSYITHDGPTLPE